MFAFSAITYSQVFFYKHPHDEIIKLITISTRSIMLMIQYVATKFCINEQSNTSDCCLQIMFHLFRMPFIEFWSLHGCCFRESLMPAAGFNRHTNSKGVQRNKFYLVQPYTWLASTGKGRTIPPGIPANPGMAHAAV